MSEGDPNPFDITLVVKDGKEFQAHRNVLSQASPFFEKLLNSDMKENNEGVMHQSIPAVPIPPGNRGAFPNVASSEGGAFAYLGSTPGHLTRGFETME